MSSPIAGVKRNPVKRGLIALHQQLSHRSRTRLLAKVLSATLRKLVVAGTADAATQAIDIGCGDMRIAELLAEFEPRIRWTCLDVHPLPAEAAEAQSKWAKYRQFDGRCLAYADRSFAAALFCDVLHHVPETDRAGLLREAGRVARYVVIKDHFEYDRASRTVLRAMDFVGNWGYGVNVPRRYFARDSFALLLSNAGLELVSMIVGIQLSGHLPLLRRLLDPDWQFIAVARAR
jgi:SAM-dependent methyltransferase